MAWAEHAAQPTDGVTLCETGSAFRLPEPDDAARHRVDDEPQPDGQDERCHDEGRVGPPARAARADVSDLIHGCGERHPLPIVSTEAPRPEPGRPPWLQSATTARYDQHPPSMSPSKDALR